MHLLIASILLLQQPDPAPPAPTPPPAEAEVQTDAKKLAIDGQFRFRFEYRDPAGYDSVAALGDNDDLFLTRIRLNFKYAVQDDIDVFAQVQDAREFGSEATVSSNEKNLDLKQGWCEIRNLLGQPLTLRVGRQEVAYGDGRILSPLDWHNVGRSFDGAKARYAGEGWWADLFYYVVKEGTGAEDDQDFGGGYVSYTGLADHEVDAYLLLREFNNNAFTGEDGAVGDLRDRTAGLRVKGRQGGLDYTAEGMLQGGSFSEDRIRAHAFAFTAGWTFDIDWKPRVGVEVTQASGDDDAADGDHESYDPLYPFGHYYQGFADQFSFRNGRDVALYLKAAPCANVTVHADLHSFALVAMEDAWFNATGGVIRQDASGNSGASVGSEVDLHVRWSPVPALKIWSGYSYFRAGTFVEDTGPSPDLAWFFLQMVVEF